MILHETPTKTRFNFAHKIAKPFGVIEEILDWTKREVSTDWRWQLIEVSATHKNGEYIFYFDSERDYLAFLMKWA